MPPWLRTFLTRERRRTRIRELLIANSQVNLSSLHRLMIQSLIIVGRTGFLDLRRVLGNPWMRPSSQVLSCWCIPTIPTCPPSFTKGWCRSALWLICKSSPAAFLVRFILMESILGLPSNLEPFIMVASTGLDSLFFNCHL